MTQRAKPTWTRRFFTWLLTMMAGFIVKRIAKRAERSGRAAKPRKSQRKYVENKAK